MDTVSRAELGIDGNCGFALLGPNIQEGEVEFEKIRTTEPLWSSEGVRQSKLAINRAFTRLKSRLGGSYEGKEISYFLGQSYPDHR